MVNNEAIEGVFLKEKMVEFTTFLVNEEKSESTMQGYTRNIKRFIEYVSDCYVTAYLKR